MAKQNFQEIIKVANDFHAELDKQKKPKRSALTEKYINLLLFTAAQRGELWAM